MSKIRMPMDEELYDAAVAVIDEIEEKLAAHRDSSVESVLGHRLADAYKRWQTLLIGKYSKSADDPTDSPLDTLHPTHAAERKPRWEGGHPWRNRAVLPKRS